MLRIVYFWLSVFLLAVLQPISAADPHFADAPLRAVQFVDSLEGWAVGDDGTILHSIDGGDTWERQSCGVRASLRSIHFLTPYSGWIVGRQETPDGRSVGVVLRTSDGGLHWNLTALNAVPGLNAVRFFDEKSGMAAGDRTQMPLGDFIRLNFQRQAVPDLIDQIQPLPDAEPVDPQYLDVDGHSHPSPVDIVIG